MRVLVTGAGGYIGSTLLAHISEKRVLGTRKIEALAAADLQLSTAPAEVVCISGDLGHQSTLEQMQDFQPDVVFHLAAVPGGTAEADYDTGRRVNLTTTLNLFEALAARGSADVRAPVVVYASTVAVYGADLPDVVTSHTPLRPAISYGAHKLASEILLADFSRRKWLDGRSIRLPGIVARPRSPSGLVSAFMSDLLHALSAGEPFTCPVGPKATAWWMSARRCAENLMHAAIMDVSRSNPEKAWPLPVLRLSIEEVVRTMAEIYGSDRLSLVRYEPNPQIEAVFGRYPALDDSESRSLGLADDTTPHELVQRALGEKI